MELFGKDHGFGNHYLFQNKLSYLADDKDVVLMAVGIWGHHLMYASPRLQADIDVALTAARNDGSVLCRDTALLDTWRRNYQVVLAAVQSYGLALGVVSEELRGDHNIVLAAVQNDGSALMHASPQLQANHQIVLAAVSSRTERFFGGRAMAFGHALLYASHDLQRNREIVTRALQNGLSFGQVPEELRNNREVAFHATQYSVCVLRYCSDEFRADEELVKAAVKFHGMQLKFASDDLRDNASIVLAAVRGCGEALKHASYRLRSDKQIVLAALVHSPLALEFAAESFRMDNELVGMAVERDGRVLAYASEEMKGYRRMVVTALASSSGFAFRYASAEIKGDQEIALTAVGLCCSNFLLVSKDLQNQPKFVAAVLRMRIFQEQIHDSRRSYNYRIAQKTKWCGDNLLVKLRAMATVLETEREAGASPKDLGRSVACRVTRFEKKTYFLRHLFSLYPEDVAKIIADFLGDEIDGLFHYCAPVLKAYGDIFGGCNPSAIIGNRACCPNKRNGVVLVPVPNQK